MSERRTEVISLRFTADEKQRMTEAAERHGKNLSDWMRDELARRVGVPLVFPSQNITVSLRPAESGREDVIRSLRLALAAAERRNGGGSW